MQANRVELPPEELIEPGVLAKAIVEALYPEKTEGLTGLECIGGKLVEITSALPAKNRDLDFGAEHDSFGEKLFAPLIGGTDLPPQFELPIPKMEFTQDSLTKVVEDENSPKFRLPFRLTDEDRKKLEPLLNSLPPLTYPMSDYAISRFLDAYQALPQRLSWVPTIITSKTIERRLEERYATEKEHMKAFRQEIKEGKLSACDMRRVPTKSLSIGTFIPRSSAVEYLKRCGLSVKEELHPAVGDNEDEQCRQEGIYTASGSRVSNKKATDETWTVEELDAVKAKLDSIDPETQKKYTNRKVAKLIGLKSAGRITQLMKMFKDRRKVPTTAWQTGMLELSGLNKKR